MFPYKKLAVLAVALSLGVPSVSMAGSFAVSLVQGKTPSEAVQIISEHIDLLSGRVASLEYKQVQLESDVSKNKGNTEREIERLKLENENLRLKTDEALTGTARTRANEARSTQCAEGALQIGTKVEAVSSPFRAQMKPLHEEISVLQHQLLEKKRGPVSDASDSNDAETHKARLNALQEAIRAIEAQIKVKRDEVNVISVEMNKSLETLRSTAEFKTLQDRLVALLCA